MNFLQWMNNVYRRTPVVQVPEDTGSPRVRRCLRFSGIVQGVGFRYEAKMAADQLDLVGWVQNQSDGSVVVEIEGKKNYIQAFLLALEAVPRFDITEIQTKELPLSNTESSFVIR